MNCINELLKLGMRNKNSSLKHMWAYKNEAYKWYGAVSMKDNFYENMNVKPTKH